MTNNANTIADNLLDELLILGRTKRMKVKKLLKYFNYDRRTEDNATQITRLLLDRNILLLPTIMKLENGWQLKLDDQVYLSISAKGNGAGEIEPDMLPEDWNNDGWFDTLNEKKFKDEEKFRNEKEVESKFLVPLLKKLGYNDDDRYDGKIVKMGNGSRPQNNVADYVLRNAETKIEELKTKTLLIAEGKYNDHIKRFSSAKWDGARNQLNSYLFWESCLFGLLTDSVKIEVIKLSLAKGNKELVFECNIDNLKDRFRELYRLISKDNLTYYHEKQLEKFRD